MYVSTLLTYVLAEWPQTRNGNPKIRLDNCLGSTRVEDAKGVNLNTILIKLKCENTQHKMDCVELSHPTQLCYFQFSSFAAVSLTWYFYIKFWDYYSLSFYSNLSCLQVKHSDSGFFLLFLLSRTESLCLLIFLYILMFHHDHRKYYKGCYGKLKKRFWTVVVRFESDCYVVYKNILPYDSNLSKVRFL